LRYLILSDTHGNLEALTAVATAARDQYDYVLCLGDVVGYGADPNAVTDWVRQNAMITIRGNHDRACSSLVGLDWFNPLAQAATRWTHDALTETNRNWLHALPSGPAQIEDFQLVHGSPLDEDDYLVNVMDAAQAFQQIDAPLTFFGHTHLQGAFEYRHGKTARLALPSSRHTFAVDDGAAYLVNPGSVGQPRDRDPRAAFALYDRATRSLELCRIAYDVDEAQRKILDAGMPAALAERLAMGR